MKKLTKKQINNKNIVTYLAGRALAECLLNMSIDELIEVVRRPEFNKTVAEVAYEEMNRMAQSS